jgi:hypothetical protein
MHLSFSVILLRVFSDPIHIPDGNHHSTPKPQDTRTPADDMLLSLPVPSATCQAYPAPRDTLADWYELIQPCLIPSSGQSEGYTANQEEVYCECLFQYMLFPEAVAYQPGSLRYQLCVACQSHEEPQLAATVGSQWCPLAPTLDPLIQPMAVVLINVL